MRFCLAFILLFLVAMFAGATIGFNFFSNQSLEFEFKNDPDEFINTRRSFRPLNVDEVN